jgi:hypothetical protein
MNSSFRVGATQTSAEEVDGVNDRAFTSERLLYVMLAGLGRRWGIRAALSPHILTRFYGGM